MKKITALMLAFCLLFVGCTAQAASFTDSLKGLIDDTASFVGDLSDDIANGANEALNAISGALDETGKTLSDLWSAVPDTVSDIWGSITDGAQAAWDWTLEQGTALKGTFVSLMDDLKTVLDDSITMTVEMLENSFKDILNALEITGESAENIWNTIKAYAEEHNIDILTIGKLSLAIIVRIALKNSVAGAMADTFITEIVIAWFVEFDITTEEKAEAALKQAVDSLPTSAE